MQADFSAHKQLTRLSKKGSTKAPRDLSFITDQGFFSTFSPTDALCHNRQRGFIIKLDFQFSFKSARVADTHANILPHYFIKESKVKGDTANTPAERKATNNQ